MGVRQVGGEAHFLLGLAADGGFGVLAGVAQAGGDLDHDGIDAGGEGWKAELLD